MKEELLTKKEQLISLCNDFNLPVSPADSVVTLENFLKAAYDDTKVYAAESVEDYIFLENDPVYIGKSESKLKVFFLRLLPI